MNILYKTYYMNKTPIETIVFGGTQLGLDTPLKLNLTFTIP